SAWARCWRSRSACRGWAARRSTSLIASGPSTAGSWPTRRRRRSATTGTRALPSRSRRSAAGRSSDSRPSPDGRLPLQPRRLRMHPIASVLLALVSAGAPPAAATDAEVKAKVDAVFREYDRSDSPGCALGVYRDGTIVYERGYGMANLELGVANSPE